MGMYDNVQLSPVVLGKVRESYQGEKELRFNGWQTKSLSCELRTVELTCEGIIDGGELRPYFAGEIRFYQDSGTVRHPSWEWLEFVAEYQGGKLVDVTHLPERNENQ